MRTKPKIELDLQKVEEYAGLGLTREEIALSLGISYSTLNRRIKESEDVDAAMKRGRAKANIKVGNALMKAIEGGNVTAIIFYLKARAGWTEKQQIELLNRARVTVPADSDDVDVCSQDGRVLCEGSGGVFEGRDRR